MFMFFTLLTIFSILANAPILAHATDYNYLVSFNDKVVANFDDHRPNLNSGTVNLSVSTWTEYNIQYYFNSCPFTGAVVNAAYEQSIRRVSDNYRFNARFVNLPDLVCDTSPRTYNFTLTWENNITQDELAYITDIDNSNGWLIEDFFSIYGTSETYGRIANMEINFKSYIKIDFDTNYLWTHILLDDDLETVFPSSGVSVATQVNRPYVVFASNEYDNAFIYNTDTSTNTNRTKYAIDAESDDTMIISNAIGAGLESNSFSQWTIKNTGLQSYLGARKYLYLLNFARTQAVFPDTIIDLTPNYAVCDTALGIFPNNCTLNGEPIGSFEAMANNTFEYLTKELPIVSDLIQLIGPLVNSVGRFIYTLTDLMAENIVSTILIFGIGIAIIFGVKQWLL